MIREHGNQCVSNVIQHVSLATPYRVATKLFLLIGPTVIGFISCCGLTRPHIDHACFFHIRCRQYIQCGKVNK